MEKTLLIAAGGAVGSVARYWLGEAMAALLGAGFPWGTLAANVSGSMLIGILAGLLGPDGRPLLSVELRLLLMVGLCGGFTTFSSFSLQTLEMAQNGELGRAGFYVAGSLLTCLVGVWLGWLLARVL